MKKLAIPLLLLLVGVALTAFSFISGGSTSGELDVEIVKTSTIMPAAHNVYANPDALNGKYFLFKTKITNNTNKTLEDVTVRYRIPGYIDWTELDVIGEMYQGQTASVLCYPKFKEDIAEKTAESTEKAEIEISWDGAEEDDIVEEDFSFRISNRNEYMFTNIPSEEIAGWGDVYNNDALLACFVTPNDPIVKYYTQNIQEKILKGEAAGVTKDPKEAVRFLAGIYQATMQSGMVYSGTKGIPESLQDVSQLSQHNRLPREVITGNTGLCLELSLLYASVLSNAGLDPIIFLVPGHAYPGFKLNGQFYALEATGIGGEGLGGSMSVEQAFEKGMKQLGEFMQYAQQGDPRYTLVDIHAVNLDGATPMNLKDDDFLRKKVDDIVAAWSTNGLNMSNNAIAQNSSGGGNNSGGSSNSSNGGNTVSRGLSFSIPSGWQTYQYPYPDLPILTAQVVSPSQEVVVSVFDVQTNSPQVALQTVANGLAYYGSEIQYQFNGNQIVGQTYSQNGTLNWIGKTVKGPNGLRFVAVGSYDYLYNQNSSQINQIFNSIR
ncbi:hypothetical protein KXJ69_02250 [Aureisphaera sp. CAU 1614]|uniref:Uncharacterized protein n=1 Tax=Halomarinibacterium sedimenti TaxID=2857106 RepID=A0A9X1FMD6_9FLAO|nr:hypothetical protein [Halomarinibacterium sedimenti]MBW2936908.1 hypothetical protein [Halomarinibacterium sedimenti]